MVLWGVLLKGTGLCLTLAQKGLGLRESLPDRSGVMHPNVILSSRGYVLEP